MHRWRGVAGIVLATSLAIAGCSGGSDKSDEGASPSGAANAGTDGTCTPDKVGGSVTMAPTALGVSLDPATAAGGSAQTGLEELALYGSLLRFDEKTNSFVGEYAESITPNADFSEWTLKMRPEVKFGNGNPMDAAAVQASIARNIDPKGKSRLRTEGRYIKSMEVVDNLTLKFVLNQPWGFFPIELSAGGGNVGALGMIQDVTEINKVGADRFGQNPGGGAAGPYEVETWNAPQQVVLKAKQNWWGGTVCIQKLTFVALTSGKAKYDALKNNEVNVATLSRDPVLIDQAAKDFPGARTVDQGNSIIEFNYTNKELADPVLREAVALAIDPAVINNRAFGGKQLASKGLAYEDKDSGITGTEGAPYDPEKAKALVGQLKAKGYNLSFTLLCSSSPSANVQAAIAIKSLLDAVGFNITVEPKDQAQMISQVYVDRNFQIWMGGQVGPAATEYASLSRYGSSNPASPYGMKNADFDAAVDKLRLADDTGSLNAALSDVQEVWNRDFVGVVYASDRPALVWTDNVHGLRFTRGITPYFDKAYISK